MDIDAKKFFEELVGGGGEPIRQAHGEPTKTSAPKIAKAKPRISSIGKQPAPTVLSEASDADESEEKIDSEPGESEATEEVLAISEETVDASEEEAALGDEREGQLTIDVYQTPEAIIVESPIAGVRSEDLEINLTSESVTIRGKRERQRTIEDKDYFYQECYWGRFSRSVILPQEIDPDKSEAGIKNGVLTLLMPKLTRAKQKRLKIKSE